MFCSTCGNQLPDEAKFCSSCGTAITVEVDQMQPVSENSSEPLLTIRPVFIPLVKIATIIPVTLFFTVWAGGFFGGFSMVGLKAIGIDSGPYTFIAFGLLALIGVPFATIFASQRTYAKTEYRFYPDRLEYAEGFWTVQNKTIKYSRITEVSLHRGVIQKKYGLGTLILATPATSMSQNRPSSGIKVADIKNSEDIYEQVQKLIG